MYFREFKHETGRRFRISYRYKEQSNSMLCVMYAENTEPIMYIAQLEPKSELVALSFVIREQMCEKLVNKIVKAIRKKEVKYIKLPTT